MSRSLDDLLPQVKEKAEELLKNCAEKGIRLLVTQTLRTYAEQDALYAQGRTTPGAIVTHAKGGQSWHNVGRAFDVVPLDANGKPNWKATLGEWAIIGATGKAIGLEWGGDWPWPKKDMPHFQLTNGLTLEQEQQNHKEG